MPFLNKSGALNLEKNTYKTKKWKKVLGKFQINLFSLIIENQFATLWNVKFTYFRSYFTIPQAKNHRFTRPTAS